MALISIARESYVFDPIIKEKGDIMKSYEVILKQTVEGTVAIRATTKAEAKEVAEELIKDNKMQHLIQDVEDLEGDSWEVESVEDY